MARAEFVILGTTAFYVDGRSVPLGSTKQRGLLSLLLYHVGEPVRLDTIIEELWGDADHDNHRASLYALVSRTRAVLSGAGINKALARARDTSTYQLNVDPNLVDYHRFRRMTAAARGALAANRHDAATEMLSGAISLWRAEPLPELRGVRAERARRFISEAHLEAHKLLAECQLHDGSPEAALELIEPLLQVHEMDEILAQLWIDALCASERRDEARVFAATFRRQFRREIHVPSSVEVPGQTGRPQARNAMARKAGANAPASLPPQQLRPDISDFVGRDALLTELDALTDPAKHGSKIAILTGMPAVGKTTLVVHWAHQRRGRFPDGQIYLDCHAYGPVDALDADQVLLQLLRAFDVSAAELPLDWDGRLNRLRQLLAGRRVLVVLDNVRDSDQVRPLFATSAHCVTLITSRSRLTGLTIRQGVRNLTVPPLSDQECGTLLGRVIGTRRTEAEPEALADLTKLSGGLPLALRIIGEHVAERERASLADLIDVLRGDLLGHEVEGDEEATLSTVFAWSYNALSPPTARMFRLLGLHPGLNISPEAAAALRGGTAAEAEHLLNALAKAHLINHDVVRRYRFHDLLRRYAENLIRTAEPAQTRQRAMRSLLDWYLLTATNAAELLAPQRTPVPDLPDGAGIQPQVFATDTEAMKWCEAERANVGAVTRWAACHRQPGHAWKIQGTVCEIFDRFGRQDDGLELQELAYKAARTEGHLLGQIGSLINLGASYFAMHEYEQARKYWSAALELARQHHYTEAENACSHNLASVHLMTGDPVTAIGIFNTVLETCRAKSFPIGEGATLHRLGDAYRQMRDYGRATTHYLRALEIREQLGSLSGQGKTHGELAALFLETRQYDDSLAHCRLALAICRRTRDEAACCDALITKANVERELGLHHESIQDAQEAVTLSEETMDAERRVSALIALTAGFAALGDAAAAKRTYHEAMGALVRTRYHERRALRARLLRLADVAG